MFGFFTRKLIDNQDAEILVLKARLNWMYSVLVSAHAVLHFDLRKMREDGPHYNQAVKDVGDQITRCLKVIKPDDWT